MLGQFLLPASGEASYPERNMCPLSISYCEKTIEKLEYTLEKEKGREQQAKEN